MTVKSDNYQTGVSATASNNFTTSTDAAGGWKLSRGNAGATTQDIMAVDANGTVTFPYNALLSGQSAGQCKLIQSGGNLVLNRENGSYILINGVFRQIPVAGVSLSVTGASANFTYYIYASWTGSAIALGFSTAAPVIDSTYGIKVKIGDATQTLVGQARTNAGINWVDNANQRFVLSWYNRTPKFMANPLTNTVTVNGTTNWTQVGPNLEFLTWGGEMLELSTFGIGSVDATNYCYLATDIDLQMTPLDPGSIIQQAGSNSFNYPIALTYRSAQLSEGYHNYRMIAKNNSPTATSNFNGNITAGTGRVIANGWVMG